MTLFMNATRSRLRHFAIMTLAVLLAVAIVPLAGQQRYALPGPNDSMSVAQFGKLPLQFEQNAGQTDPSVKFLMRTSGGTFYFTTSEVVAVLASPAYEAGGADGSSTVARIQFVGANATPGLSGGELLPGKVNYLMGGDSSQWRTGLPAYSDITYTGIYPGIDLAYAGHEGQLKSTYNVAAGADPSSIRWRYQGAQAASVDADGNLQVRLSPQGPGEPITITEQAPVAWQDVRGKRVPVSAHYRLHPDGSIGFLLGSYDKTQPLVVDPTLTYSTYLGGSGSDYGVSAKVDVAGNIYLIGTTRSTNFPLVAPYQPHYGGGTWDLFVAKLNPSGSALLYSTYLGGSGEDRAVHNAIDPLGNMYISAMTSSTNFPVMNAIQPSYGGGSLDAVIVKLNPSGSALVYSTYLGGSSIDEAGVIAVDLLGSAYLVGNTYSTNFPLANPYQSTRRGIDDAFLAKLNPSGSALVYSTYFGGSAADAGYGLAVDLLGNAYISGYTLSTDLPLANPYQPSFGGYGDAFVTKFNSTGSALVYSTYLGGSGNDVGEGIEVDALGNAYQTGYTDSLNFPVVNPLQPSRGGGNDAFITKFSPSGSTLVYSTYLGGSGDDIGSGMAVDLAGYAHVAGGTTSPNFPVVKPIQATLRGMQDAFAVKLDRDGSALVYSTYLGGTSEDMAPGVAVDNADNAYLIGYTSSANFPTVHPYQPSNAGSFDAFIARITDPLPIHTVTPTHVSTHTPTHVPTHMPTHTPTRAPTHVPTHTPTQIPTHVPTHMSTRTPTYTSTPTHIPINTPTHAPTDTPTHAPTHAPTNTPTHAPTHIPTHTPTHAPTDTPTSAPTNTPASISTSTIAPTATRTPCAGAFTDVAPSDYYSAGVGYLYCRQVVSGYGDGTFRPYNNTTRAQIAKMIVLAYNLSIYTPDAPTFTDVSPSDGFYLYIETAARNSIVSGYSDRTFSPHKDVTRSQLTKIVVSAAQWPLVSPATPSFRDVPSDSTFYSYIETAACHGIIGGYADGTFRPGNSATRGQIAKILYEAVRGGQACSQR